MVVENHEIGVGSGFLDRRQVSGPIIFPTGPDSVDGMVDVFPLVMARGCGNESQFYPAHFQVTRLRGRLEVPAGTGEGDSVFPGRRLGGKSTQRSVFHV